MRRGMRRLSPRQAARPSRPYKGSAHRIPRSSANRVRPAPAPPKSSKAGRGQRRATAVRAAPVAKKAPISGTRLIIREVTTRGERAT